MFTFIEVRREAARLARDIRCSVLEDSAAWTVGCTPHEGVAVANGSLWVTITPRVLRILDRVYLYCDGAEVWMPLLSRVRLRNAVRLLAIRHADLVWQRQNQEPLAERRSRSA